MPGGDRTGPLGLGPMSGRGAGYCGGPRARRFTGAAGGGAGRGWRHWFFATGLPGWMRGAGASFGAGAPAVRADLEDHARVLQQELDATKQRLSELSQEPKP
ncbi:MAG: hypothetical protein EHM56_14945 [Chloroflexi bacterium]|nr:MAG: hypothetical protein EHM56_14945 [Chloroflexota bacterium]